MTTKDEDVLRLALEALEEMLAAERATNRPPETVMQAEAKLDRIRKAAAQCLEAITAILEALAQPAGERGELIRKAMRKAYSLGQTYWQQADSEFTSHHKKADATHTKFITLVEETAALLSSDAQPSEWVSISDDEIYGMYNEPRSDAEMVEFARELESKLKEKNHGK